MTKKSTSEESDAGIICLIWIGCAVLGSLAAVQYVKIRKHNSLYEQTTCLLLNYTSVTHNCESCTTRAFGGRQCKTYTCYDESFEMCYMISNGTTVTTALSVRDEQEPHKESEVWLENIWLIWMNVWTRRILEEHHNWLDFYFRSTITTHVITNINTWLLSYGICRVRKLNSSNCVSVLPCSVFHSSSWSW
jgi:hypothetical protein